MVSAINKHIRGDHHNKHPRKVCASEKKPIMTKHREHLLLRQGVDVCTEKLPNSFIATE